MQYRLPYSHTNFAPNALQKDFKLLTLILHCNQKPFLEKNAISVTK